MALPDFYSQWTQARQNGAQRADDQAVRQNIGGALQGDSGALAAILKASPQTGMQVQSYAQGQRKVQQEDAGKAASMFAQTGDPQFYAMWKQSLAGLPNAPQLPDSLEPDDLEPAKQSAQAFAQAYGSVSGVPAGVQEFKYMTQGLGGDDVARARRIALGLDGRASSAGFQSIEADINGVPTRLSFDPRTNRYSMGELPGTGAPQTMQPQGGDPFSSLRASIPGLRVTSGQRTPERNTAVGGVPNSFHLTGQAIDVGTPTAAQQVALTQWAAQNGMEIIRNYKDGHWHLEPRGASPNGRAITGRTKEAEAAAIEAAKQGIELGNLPLKGSIEAENEAKKARAQAEAKAAAERDSTAAQKAADANRALMLLDQAETLIPLSTGSAVGNLVDAGASLFGQSTDGAQAIAALQTIAGQLTSSMPRMQGPQSDKDVQLYKQMAGDLANPSLPRATRIAALNQIRALNKKYATQEAPSASQSGSWSIKVKP